MNRCTERLYNGLVKENPTFRLSADAGYVSSSCRNYIRNQWCWYGFVNNSSIGIIQYADFHVT